MGHLHNGPLLGLCNGPIGSIRITPKFVLKSMAQKIHGCNTLQKTQVAFRKCKQGSLSSKLTVEQWVLLSMHVLGVDC